MKFVQDIHIDVVITTSRGHLMQTFTSKENETVAQFMARVCEWVKKECESFQ